MEGIRPDEELLLKSSSTETYWGFESLAFRPYFVLRFINYLDNLIHKSIPSWCNWQPQQT